MSSQEIAQHSPADLAVAAIRNEGFKAQIEQALPDNVPVRRFERAAVTALRANPDIAKCDHNSLFLSLIRAAQDGLMPDGREAALVKFGDKVTYLPMVAGYRKIAAEHGWTILSAVVYSGDEFDYELGLAPGVKHKPALGSARGDLVAAYAIGSKVGEVPVFEVMLAEDIEKVRSVSRSKDRGPWVDWKERMWEKTAARRLFAKLPLGDPDLVERIVNADELAPGEAARLVYGGNGSHEQGPHAALASGQSAGAQSGLATPTPAEPAAEPDPPEIEGEPEDVEAPAEASPFQPPSGVAVSEVQSDADTAGMHAFPVGKFKGLTIRQVYDEKRNPNKSGKPEGEAYIVWAVGSLSDERFRSALVAFARFYMPAEYQRIVAQQELGS